MMLALGVTSPETIEESQKLTIDKAPGFGLTTYREAGSSRALHTGQ